MLLVKWAIGLSLILGSCQSFALSRFCQKYVALEWVRSLHHEAVWNRFVAQVGHNRSVEEIEEYDADFQEFLTRTLLHRWFDIHAQEAVFFAVFADMLENTFFEYSNGAPGEDLRNISRRVILAVERQQSGEIWVKGGERRPREKLWATFRNRYLESEDPVINRGINEGLVAVTHAQASGLIIMTQFYEELSNRMPLNASILHPSPAQVDRALRAVRRAQPKIDKIAFPSREDLTTYTFTPMPNRGLRLRSISQYLETYIAFATENGVSANVFDELYFRAVQHYVDEFVKVNPYYPMN